MAFASHTPAVVTLIATLLGTTLIAHVVLRTTCSGPPAPRALLSLTCGLIAAGAVAFATLIR